MLYRRQKLASLSTYLKYIRMWGFSHSCEPELDEGGAVDWVTLNRWRPMKGAQRGL